MTLVVTVPGWCVDPRNLPEDKDGQGTLRSHRSQGRANCPANCSMHWWGKYPPCTDAEKHKTSKDAFEKCHVFQEGRACDLWGSWMVDKIGGSSKKSPLKRADEGTWLGFYTVTSIVRNICEIVYIMCATLCKLFYRRIKKPISKGILSYLLVPHRTSWSWTYLQLTASQGPNRAVSLPQRGSINSRFQAMAILWQPI